MIIAVLLPAVLVMSSWGTGLVSGVVEGSTQGVVIAEDGDFTILAR